MRATFVFPPRASPTYVPLGLASLVPCVRREVPACSVQALDLNLEAWDRVARRETGGEALLRFFRGRESFFDEPSYKAHQETWSRIRVRMGLLAQEAARYLASGSASQDFLLLLDGLTEKTLASDPELVGFSALYLEQVPFALALCRLIKERSLAQASCPGTGRVRRSPRLVVGGAALSALREDELLTACSFVDAILVGEGEPAAVALCSGQSFMNVPGIVYRSPSGIRRNKRSWTVSLHGLPPPDFSSLPLDNYLNPSPVLPVLFSRGCRWRKCRFCAHNASFAGYRRKSAKAFVDELEGYQRMHGARHFYLADQYVEAEDLDRVAEEILRRRMEVFFHVMGRPIEGHTPDRLDRLFQAGCRWICWGVESGSQRLLDLINKGTCVREMGAFVQRAAEAGISNLAMMIFGLPTSTDADFAQTVRFLEGIYPSLQAMSSSAFVLWEGTHFARRAGLYRMRVTGPQPFLTCGGRTIHSNRLRFLAVSEDGSLRLPRGPMERREWEDRRRWLGECSFLEQLPCEHYLLYASHRAQGGSKPLSPLCRAA